MGKLTLEQEINRTPEIPDHYIEGEPEAYMDGWKAGMREGAKWQKEQCAELVKEALNKFQTAVKLLDTLVYYSHIKMVSGVRPANMVTHEQASKAAQQWLHDNCVMRDGEYFLINPEQLQD
jgi:hypothetical protein